MTITEWIGYFVAVAIVFALGFWLHRVGKQPARHRVEAIALWAGWAGALTVGAARLGGVA